MAMRIYNKYQDEILFVNKNEDSKNENGIRIDMP